MTPKDIVQNFRAEISDFKIALDLKKFKSPLWGKKKNFAKIWHYIHQKMRIEKTKPGEKSILKIFILAWEMAKKLAIYGLFD